MVCNSVHNQILHYSKLSLESKSCNKKSNKPCNVSYPLSTRADTVIAKAKRTHVLSSDSISGTVHYDAYVDTAFRATRIHPRLNLSSSSQQTVGQKCTVQNLQRRWLQSLNTLPLSSLRQILGVLDCACHRICR